MLFTTTFVVLIFIFLVFWRWLVLLVLSSLLFHLHFFNNLCYLSILWVLGCWFLSLVLILSLGLSLIGLRIALIMSLSGHRLFLRIVLIGIRLNFGVCQFSISLLFTFLLFRLQSLGGCSRFLIYFLFLLGITLFWLLGLTQSFSHFCLGGSDHLLFLLFLLFLC